MGFARSDFRSFRRAFVALCLVGLATPIVGSTAAAQGSGASISGTVLDGDGLPVADLTVLACPASGVPSAGSFCDGNIFADVDGGTGSYTLSDLAPDTYNVYAGRGGVDFLSEPTQVTVDEDDLVAGIDFAFDSKVAGIVTDPNTDPVEGAEVHLYRDYMNPLLSAYELGTTGVAGDYVSPYLPAGTYTLRVEPAPGGGLARAEVADVVVPPVTASPPVTVDVQLEAGATVSGTVLDGAGSPVVTATGKNTGAYVCPAPVELIEGGCVGQFLTFADEITGEYTIEGITPGDYSSGAFGTVPTLPGDPQGDGVIINTAAVLVPILANDALTQNFVFDSRVAGVVTEGGAPVEGAEIALAPGGSYDGEISAGIAVTDAAGFYETPYLPATGFTLQMTPPPGSGLGTLQRSVTLTEGAVTTMNWPEATLTGTVLDADTGDPFDGITGVNICPGADQVPGGCPGFQSVQADEAGVYSVTLGEGTYSVGPFTFLDNVVGVGPPTINVTVTDGQTTVQDLEIDVLPRIEGTVADRNGVPVPGRGVIACPDGPPGPSGCPGQINAGTFTLDGSARYALVGLAPDEDYNVVSFGNVGEAVVGAPGAVYSLGATEVLTRDWVFDSTIEGRVLAPDGVTPVDGVSVRFVTGSGPVGGGGEVAVTEPDGRFETPFLPQGTYALRLVPPAGSGLPETTIPNVIVPANTDHDAGDLMLVTTGTVSGTVLDVDTGASFDNLSGVNVCPGTGGITPGCPGPQFAIANPSGAYSIDLAPGDWSIHGWTFLGPTETSVLAASAHVVVTVSEGATTEQDFEIDVLPRIEGTVTDRNGDPVPNRGVSVCPDAPPSSPSCPGQFFGHTFTVTPSAKYAVTGLDPGRDYHLSGFGSVGEAVVGIATEAFTLGATDIVTQNWVMDSTIRGRVLGPDGVTPVGGVSVQFFAGGGPIGQGGEVAATEPDGTFATPFLPQATYSLRLVPPAGSGLPETTVPGVVVPANTDHDAGDLVLTPSGTLEGTVLDADTGDPFTGSTGVAICSGAGQVGPNCPGFQSTPADGSGVYSVNLGEGTYSVSPFTFLDEVAVGAPWVNVEVTEGQVTIQDFTIDLLPRIEGTITDRDGVGVPGRGVIACPDGPPGPTGCAGQINAATFTTDGSPRYALTGLVPDDDYWVTGFGLVGEAVVGMPTEVFTLDATEIVTKDWVFDSTIAGRVLAPDGITPVGGVSVRFFPGGGPIGGPGGEVAATEPDGTFQTPFLPEANYSLRLVPPAGSGLAETTIEDVVVPANTDHDAGDLVLIGEADGVPDAVEDGAPNGGDGNGDGILDSVQAHVTSLPNAVDGQYVTLEAAVGTTLANVEAIDPATLTPEPPAGAQLPVGVLGFEVLVANPGDAADVVLHLPAGLSVDEYLKLHDGTWTAFPGASFDGDTVTLSLVDGGAGDDDDTADGVIIEPGGPATLAEQQTATLEVSADTYLRSGNDNTNEGAATFLQVRSSGNNRALVAVDATALDELIGGGEIISAELELDVVENGGNWGSEGRTVDIHRLTSAWAEGNGFVADHQPTDRGSGEGATWNCAIDAEIANQRPDCDGPTEWEMGKPNQPELHPWEPDPTDTLLITSDLSGEVGFDVTDDVLAFTSGSEAHHGWIIKKTVEGANGKVRFSSRQGTSAPRLVITYIPS